MRVPPKGKRPGRLALFLASEWVWGLAFLFYLGLYTLLQILKVKEEAALLLAVILSVIVTSILQYLAERRIQTYELMGVTTMREVEKSR